MQLRFALAAGFALVAFASPALADEEDEPATAAEATEAGPRGHGVRIGLDLSYARATGYDDPDGFAYGAPARIPVGFDLSGRVSTKVLLGVHFDAGAASHVACQRCSALTAGIGGHLEVLFRESETFVPWFRYGLGLQTVVQTDTGARGGLDLADLRFGTDFVVSRSASGKTARLGPFLGLDLGLLAAQSSTAGSSNGTPYAFVAMGVRATVDP